MRLAERDLAPAGRFIGGQHVVHRPVHVDSDEVHRRADDFEVLSSDLRRVLTSLPEVRVGLLVFEDVDVLGRADLGLLLASRPDRLHRHAVGEN